MTRRLVLALLSLVWIAAPWAAWAHETRPGYLELRETASDRYDVLWKKPARGDMVLRLDPVLPAACSVTVPEQQTFVGGSFVVRATLQCAGGIAGKSVAISGLEATLTDVLVRVYHASGIEETHLLRPAATSVVLRGTPTPVARILSYLRLGVEHILQGVDHLLFVLGLLLIVADRWMLVKTISAFTVAHSITLAIATLGYASTPVLPLNATIALSILFLGPEIVRAQRGGTSLTIRRPWLVAFAFGLLHGFGFASGLKAMGLPTGEIPLALLLFNVGVEIGQIVFVVAVVALEHAFRTLEVHWPRFARALPGYTIGSLGAYWTVQRTLMLLAAPQ